MVILPRKSGGVQKEVVYASKKVIVTVEEVVEDLDTNNQGVVIPHWLVTGIALSPKGAHPSYAMGYYKRDNSFYKQWDEISRNQETFKEWMENHVLSKKS